MNKILLTILALTAYTQVSAAGHQYDAAQLIGTWQCKTEHTVGGSNASMIIDQRINLKADGTYQVDKEHLTAIFNRKTRGYYVFSHSGQWELQGDKYKITMQKQQFAKHQPAAQIDEADREMYEITNPQIRETLSEVPQESYYEMKHLSARKWEMTTPHQQILVSCQKINRGK